MKIFYSVETRTEKFFLPLPLSVKHVSTATEKVMKKRREEKERVRERETELVSRGRDTEGYSYCLPLDGFWSLVLGTGILRSPKPLSWPYIACFKISWQLKGGTKASSMKTASWSSPEAAQTST